jgi:hypothetical protein
MAERLHERGPHRRNVRPHFVQFGRAGRVAGRVRVLRDLIYIRIQFSDLPKKTGQLLGLYPRAFDCARTCAA